jgi:hypothetical protein
MSLYRRSAPRAPRLVDDLLTLEGGEAAQLHREDRVGLDLVDVEQLHEALARLVDRRRAADERDDLVERVERLEVAAQDVHALLGLAQAELRAADDDLDLVLDPVRDEPVERERARHAVDDREHVRAEVLLQLRVLVQVVQHDLGDGIPLEDDDEPLARAIARLVADVGDAGELAVAGEVADLRATLSGFTWYGSSVITRHVRPWISSTFTTARIVIEPRPVRCASRMPLVPRICAPVGKSGPGCAP